MFTQMFTQKVAQTMPHTVEIMQGIPQAFTQIIPHTIEMIVIGSSISYSNHSS